MAKTRYNKKVGKLKLEDIEKLKVEWDLNQNTLNTLIWLYIFI
jgi:hypothetical protein